jgi:hypothetical protein
MYDLSQLYPDAVTLHRQEGSVRAASPSPETPTPPGSQEPQIEATTYDPEDLRTRGLFLWQMPLHLKKAPPIQRGFRQVPVR